MLPGNLNRTECDLINSEGGPCSVVNRSIGPTLWGPAGNGKLRSIRSIDPSIIQTNAMLGCEGVVDGSYPYRRIKVHSPLR